MRRRSSLRLKKLLLLRGAVGRALFRWSEFRSGAIPVEEEELGEATVGSEMLC